MKKTVYLLVKWLPPRFKPVKLDILNDTIAYYPVEPKFLPIYRVVEGVAINAPDPLYKILRKIAMFLITRSKIKTVQIISNYTTSAM